MGAEHRCGAQKVQLNRRRGGTKCVGVYKISGNRWCWAQEVWGTAQVGAHNLWGRKVGGHRKCRDTTQVWGHSTIWLTEVVGVYELWGNRRRGGTCCVVEKPMWWHSTGWGTGDVVGIGGVRAQHRCGHRLS